MERTIRTEMLLGEEKLNRLQNAHVAVFGIGGVGGFVVEALARAGVGALTLVDRDTVSESNLNRQIIALTNTIGRDKVDVMKERIALINPECNVDARKCFYLPDTADHFDFAEYDYIVDAVDTVTAKLELVVRAKEAGTPIISCMGTGNKLDPSQFEICDISKTSVCPLARVMRRELKKRDIDKLTVLYSKEKPIDVGGALPGSISYVPATAGLMIAGRVIQDLLEQKNYD